MQPNPTVDDQPGPVTPAELDQTPPAESDPTSPAPTAATDAPATVPPPRRSRVVVWLAAAAALVLILGGGGAYLLLRPAKPPTTIEGLRDLLVDPSDRKSTVTMLPNGGEQSDVAASPVNGGRWAVQREWAESEERTGYVLLIQFDTAAQAKSSLDYFRDGAGQDGAQESAVPARPDAYLFTLAATGNARPSSVGLGLRGTIVAILGSGTEAPDYVKTLLVEQLDRLP